MSYRNASLKGRPVYVGGNATPRLIHIVPGTGNRARALCGIVPTGRSQGWDSDEASPTCVRCISKLDKQQQKENAPCPSEIQTA